MTPNTCRYMHVGIIMFIWVWVHGWAGVCIMCVEAHEVDAEGLPTLYFSPVIETSSCLWVEKPGDNVSAILQVVTPLPHLLRQGF